MAEQLQNSSTGPPPTNGVDALLAQGLRYAQAGQLPQAVAHFRKVLQARPDLAQAHYNLGVALAEQGKLQEAAASFREAISLRPGYAEAHYALGNTFGGLDRHEEAVSCYQEAIRQRPNYADAWNNLGLSLTDVGRAREAEIALRQAMRLRPESADAHNNLGMALAERGDLVEAEWYYHQALQLEPRCVSAHVNLGSALKAAGRLQEAVACYEVALALEPDSASAHWNRALAWLQQGNFEQGWREYDWRWRRRGAKPRRFRQPAWDGSPLQGRTILLWSEQGLGDTIQFVRYTRLVNQQGGTVILSCPPPLHRLLQRCPGIDRLVPEGADPPDFDVHAPLLTLPALLGTTLASVPAEVPYLSAEPELVEHWQQRLTGLRGLRVGIVWQGNPRHKWDRYRSLPLPLLEPLARVEGVCLVSLQQGPGKEQLGLLGSRFPVTLFEDTPDDPPSFEKTAAVLKNLDLLICCDTAVAHLAGALGVPVWVAIPYLSDWRWLQVREDSPWYPTMRLFRQKRLGDWSPVFDRMTQELRRYAAATGRAQPLTVEVSPGEFLDRLAALEVRSTRPNDAEALARTQREIAALRPAAQRLTLESPQVPRLAAALRQAHADLNEAREDMAGRERAGDCGQDFLERARTVCRLERERQALIAAIDAGYRRPDSVASAGTRESGEEPSRPTSLGEMLTRATSAVDTGDMMGAERLYRQVLHADPYNVTAAAGLAEVCQASGRTSDALSFFSRALRVRPEDADLHYRRGLVLEEMEDIGEALASFRAVLRHRPDHADAHYHAGLALARQKKLAEAVKAFRAVLRHHPDHADALRSLAEALQQQGQAAEAEAAYRDVLRLRPEEPSAHNALGIFLVKQGDPASALAYFQEARRLEPGRASWHHNLGAALADSGRVSEALPSFEEALRLQPNHAEAHKGRAMAWLQLGDFARGWVEYEWRWRCQDFTRPPYRQPAWDGSSLEGRTILLDSEQGLGDTLQFVRYATLVKQLGARVVLHCPRSLERLLRTCPGVDICVAKGDPLPPFDCYASLLSLPRLLGTALETIPANVPYLFVEPEMLERWGRELGPVQGLRIGISWQGNPRHPRDRSRSVPLREFAALARVPGVRLFALQKGHGREQLPQTAKLFPVTDLGKRLEDFADTAAVMRQLDLVICCDSAVAHLAGALAVPVWLALPFAVDWRWLVGREDSPWYPSMRLFQQQKAGDWAGVFERLAGEVRRFCPGDRSRGPASS